MGLMLIITLTALIIKIRDAIVKEETPIIIMGFIVLLLAIGLIVEVIIFFWNRTKITPSLEPAESEENIAS